MQKEIAAPLARKESLNGYITLAASFLIFMITLGTQASFGVFFKPMLSEFGWTRAATSGPYSLYMIWFGICGIIYGRLSDRLGSRRVAAMCGLFLGIGYLLMSRLNSLWEFYLYYGIVVAMGASSFVPIIAMLARVFTQKRGLFNGIVASGAALGMAVFPPIATKLVNHYSWRTSLMIFGILVIIIIFIASRFLREANNNLKEGETALKPVNLSFREVARSRALWILCGVWFSAGFFFQIMIVHMVPHVTDLGYSDITAAGALSIAGLVAIGGRVGMGILSDRIGNKIMLIISFIFMAVAFVLLLFARELGILYLSAILLGIFSGVGVLVAPTIVEFFGLKALSLVTGIVVFMWAIGSSIGPTVAGYVFDASGSYFWAFLICAILSALTAVITLFLKREPEPL